MVVLDKESLSNEPCDINEKMSVGEKRGCECSRVLSQTSASLVFVSTCSSDTSLRYFFVFQVSCVTIIFNFVPLQLLLSLLYLITLLLLPFFMPMNNINILLLLFLIQLLIF